MEPLKTNVKICVLLGLFAISDRFKAKSYAFLSNFLPTSNTVFLVSISGAYFFKNVSDIEKATYAFYVLAAGLISLAWNGIVLKQQTPLEVMLLELQRIVVKRINNRSGFQYEKVESNIQIFTTRYNMVFTCAVVASMIVMPVLVAAFHYIDGNYNYNSWYLPLVTITPYNQNATIDHVFSHIIQTTGIASLVSYLCAITMTYFGVCSYIEALFTDLAQKCKKNDDEFMLKLILSQQKTLEATIKLKDNFVALIELHNTLLKVNEQRDLGVLIDSKMNFIDHINAITAKVASTLDFIKRFCYDFRDIYTLKSLYYDLVQSVLEYCSVAPVL
ncbi:uncharacterized protein LOC129565814 [Sitodiplosis mosellana]|uniref:uncharacterized protein LOC129565814 n=1 Tax=Sitodiplosis mosellana TaxID=263140 RepID=UPI002443AE39|nr:uncharacterized protein LOC129565814 [Sitodiplosis mosellana]